MKLTTERVELTPHQRIVRAARRGTGLRLNAEEVWTLGVMDDAIVTAAALDDERAETLAALGGEK